MSAVKMGFIMMIMSHLEMRSITMLVLKSYPLAVLFSFNPPPPPPLCSPSTHTIKNNQNYVNSYVDQLLIGLNTIHVCIYIKYNI